MHKFLKKEAVSYGWHTAKEHFGFFVVLLLIAGAVIFLPRIISQYFLRRMPLAAALFTLVSWALQMLFGLGLMRINLLFLAGEKPGLSELFSQYPLFFKYLGASLLYGLVAVVGFVLLIVPGIIWMIKFQFFGYLMVDKGLGPIEALRQSAKITRGQKWNLFLFGLLIGLINILGFFALVLGLLITIPTTLLAVAFVYRKLLSAVQENKTPVQTATAS